MPVSEAGKGVAAMLAACLIWGTAPLYYKLLVHIDAPEILAHRTVWSFILFALLIAAQRRARALGAALSSPRQVAVVTLAALLISTNWLVFILSVQWGRVVQAALGYYIFPLVAVMLGALVLRERLSITQWIAVAMACGAVALLTWGVGVTPWVALILSFSFGFYSLVKKQLDVGPVVSVTAEVAVLAPFGLAYLLWLEYQGAGVFGTDAFDTAMLVFSGVLTALPLILFSFAARRVTLSTVGVLQYINPTGQFLCAVVIFGEPFTSWHLAAFGLIWVGLAIYSFSALGQSRASRRLAIAAEGSGATVISSDSEASAKP